MLRIPPSIFEHLCGKLGNLRPSAPAVTKKHRVFPKMAKIPPRVFGHLSGKLSQSRWASVIRLRACLRGNRPSGLWEARKQHPVSVPSFFRRIDFRVLSLTLSHRRLGLMRCSLRLDLAEIESNRALWESQNIVDYDFVLGRSCFCDPAYTRSGLVMVRMNTVAAVVDAVTHEPRSPRNFSPSTQLSTRCVTRSITSRQHSSPPSSIRNSAIRADSDSTTWVSSTTT